MCLPDINLFRWLLILLCCAKLDLASATDSHHYFIDNPIFGGQAYIVEAGRHHKELVVLVHGLGDRASDTWTKFIPRLAEHYHVLCFDLPGFGRSTKSNQLYSPDNYVAFINYLVKKAGHSQFTLVGHSMGGNIALRFASTYPYKVKRLLLIDAAGVLHRATYSTYFEHYGIQLIPQISDQQTNDVRSVLNAILGHLARNNYLLQAGEELALNDPMLRQKLMGGKPSVIAAYAMMMTDYSKSLSSMKVPTLILWGEDDNVVPLRTGKVLATNLPNAGLIIVSQSGHVPMQDKPLLFANWLQRFVSESDASFQALLDEKLYHMDTTIVNNSQRIATCMNTSGKTFNGDYKQLTIVNCDNVVIDSARIGNVTIRNSQVVMNNCVVRDQGMAMLIEASDVQINGCTIDGDPAIEFNKAQLDIAGTTLKSRGAALVNADNTPTIQEPRSGPLALLDTNETTILFSVSHLISKYYEKTLHGPVNFKPGESW